MSVPKRTVGIEEYCAALAMLADALRPVHAELRFDAVAGPKRSGLFPAVYLSHALRLPMFTVAELRRDASAKFRRVLLVDTAVWSGRTLRKARAQLRPRRVFVAAIWREKLGAACDFVLFPQAAGVVTFFYEHAAT